jgi:DNA-binding CsgD family transcriptional regulator
VSPPEWHAEAKRLRAEGLTWREISERMGKPRTTVQAAVTGGQRNALRRAYRRAWDRAHYRGTCEHCEGPVGRQRRDRERLCRLCWVEQERRRVHARAERIVAWWAEGRTLAEIGKRLGWSQGYVGAEMHRLRAKGYDLPYRRRPRR